MPWALSCMEKLAGSWHWKEVQQPQSLGTVVPTCAGPALSTDTVTHPVCGAAQLPRGAGMPGHVLLLQKPSSLLPSLPEPKRQPLPTASCRGANVTANFSNLAIAKVEEGRSREEGAGRGGARWGMPGWAPGFTLAAPVVPGELIAAVAGTVEAAWLVVAYLVAPPVLLAAFIDIWVHTGHRGTGESPEVTHICLEHQAVSAFLSPWCPPLGHGRRA